MSEGVTMTKKSIQSASIKKENKKRFRQEDTLVQLHHLKTNLLNPCLIVSNSDVSEPF